VISTQFSRVLNIFPFKEKIKRNFINRAGRLPIQLSLRILLILNNKKAGQLALLFDLAPFSAAVT